MTARFIDGPAHDCALAFSRGPRYLRIVVDNDGTIDVLDRLTDTPKSTEAVYVYRADTPPTAVHILRRPIKYAGWFVSGVWEWMPDVDGEALRSTRAWQEWARAQPPFPAEIATTLDPVTGELLEP